MAKSMSRLDKLRANGHVFEEDGATWFRSTTFGDDKDRVLIKNDGTYTYLTPDIAYHEDKFTAVSISLSIFGEQITMAIFRG